jgi:hypothetical protein
VKLSAGRSRDRKWRLFGVCALRKMGKICGRPDGDRQSGRAMPLLSRLIESQKSQRLGGTSASSVELRLALPQTCVANRS